MTEQQNKAIIEICDIINALLNRLTYANASLEIYYSILNVYDSDQNHFLLPDINFWIVVMENCKYRALLELSKIYERSSDSASIYKVINKAEQIKGYKPEEIKRIIKNARAGTAQQDNVTKRLATLRDKGLAHADLEYAADLGRLISDTRISKSEIETMINVAEYICNELLLLFNKETRTTFVFGSNAHHILHTMKKDHNKRINSLR